LHALISLQNKIKEGGPREKLSIGF
jgi:hypothetical protein